MTTATIEEAQARLPELVEKAAAGEQVVITRGDRPVAELAKPAEAKPRRKGGFGCCKGQPVILSDDDDHLADFAEYM